MRTVNVLVTSTGTASAVSVIRALRQQDEYKIRLVAVDARLDSAGLYLAGEGRQIPACGDPGYLPALFELCRINEIEALFPIYSKEIDVVATQAGRLAELGVKTLLAAPEIVNLCNDKPRMYAFAEDLGLRIPQMVDPWSKEAPLPLYAKKVKATGDDGAMKITTEADLTYCRERNPGFIFQRFIEGREYTVDTLCDRRSDLVVCSPRHRLSVKAGQSVKGRTETIPRLVELSRLFCKKAGMVGPCNLQFIQDGPDFVFIEINPRYPAGGLMLTLAAGANIPLLALKLMLGEPATPPEVRAGVTMLRYWEEVFLDADGRPLRPPFTVPEKT